MHHSLLVASPLVVVCLVLPAVPAAAQNGTALIERNEAAAIALRQTGAAPRAVGYNPSRSVMEQ